MAVDLRREYAGLRTGLSDAGWIKERYFGPLRPEATLTSRFVSHRPTSFALGRPPDQPTIIVEAYDPPEWLGSTIGSLNHLLTLRSNWDSYGSVMLSADVVLSAISLLVDLLPPTGLAPSAVPLSGGGLQLEWHLENIDIEISFSPGEQPNFWARRSTGEETEFLLRGTSAFTDARSLVSLAHN